MKRKNKPVIKKNPEELKRMGRNEMESVHTL